MKISKETYQRLLNNSINVKQNKKWKCLLIVEQNKKC